MSVLAPPRYLPETTIIISNTSSSNRSHSLSGCIWSSFCGLGQTGSLHTACVGCMGVCIVSTFGTCLLVDLSNMEPKRP